MKKTILFLAAWFLLLCGCRENPGEPPTEPLQSGTEALTGMETAPSVDADEWLALTENGEPLYAFVYQQTDLPDGVSSADYAKIARTLAADWEEKSGVAFRVWSDRRVPDDISGVIAVGNVSGYAGNAFEDLRYNDFRVTGEEGYITLAAYTYASLWIASEQMNDALTLQGGDLYMKRSALSLSHSASYSIGALTVGGKPISDYRIDCTETEQSFANHLIATVRNTSGDVLTWADKTDTNRIVIRRNEGLNGYRIARTGTEYRLEYGDGLSETLLRLYLENRLANVTGGDTLELDSLVTVRDTIAERQMMTFNVLNVWNKGGTPGTRDDIAAQTVLSYLPDFLCLQEFDDGYRTAQGGLISQIAGSYTEVVIPGVTATNVWNPIFYLHDRYTLVEAGLVDLAEVAGAEQSTSYPGSADGKSHFRTLVWAVLRDRTDGSLFLIGNFHAGLDTANHANEAKAVSDTLKSVAETHPGCVILVGGDYNSRRSQASGAVANLLAEGFSDPYDSAKIRNDLGTWHTLGKAPDGRYETDAIDHILTIGEIDVQVYMVLTDESLWSASDHCPTVLAFSLK